MQGSRSGSDAITANQPLHRKPRAALRCALGAAEFGRYKHISISGLSAALANRSLENASNKEVQKMTSGKKWSTWGLLLTILFSIGGCSSCSSKQADLERDVPSPVFDGMYLEYEGPEMDTPLRVSFTQIEPGRFRVDFEGDEDTLLEYSIDDETDVCIVNQALKSEEIDQILGCGYHLELQPVWLPVEVLASSETIVLCGYDKPLEISENSDWKGRSVYMLRAYWQGYHMDLLYDKTTGLFFGMEVRGKKARILRDTNLSGF